MFLPGYRSLKLEEFIRNFLKDNHVYNWTVESYVDALDPFAEAYISKQVNTIVDLDRGHIIVWVNPALLSTNWRKFVEEELQVIVLELRCVCLNSNWIKLGSMDYSNPPEALKSLRAKVEELFWDCLHFALEAEKASQNMTDQTNGRLILRLHQSLMARAASLGEVNNYTRTEVDELYQLLSETN